MKPTPLHYFTPGTLIISHDAYWVECGPEPRYGRLLDQSELANAQAMLTVERRTSSSESDGA